MRSRRRTERFRLTLNGHIWLMDHADCHHIQARTRDISRSGLFLEGDLLNRPGKLVAFEFNLPGRNGRSARLYGNGMIVRNEDRDGRTTGIAVAIDRFDLRPPAPILAKAE